MMTEDQRLHSQDERGEKRKCEDFTALYPLDTNPTPTAPAAPRTLSDPTGNCSVYYFACQPISCIICKYLSSKCLNLLRECLTL